MSGSAAAVRPRLARKVRLQWDDVRDQAQLLFPEGVLILNPTAHAVLELCDGSRSVRDIVSVLAARYDGSQPPPDSEGSANAAPTEPAAATEPRERAIERDVTTFLKQMEERGWLACERPGAEP